MLFKEYCYFCIYPEYLFFNDYEFIEKNIYNNPDIIQKIYKLNPDNNLSETIYNYFKDNEDEIGYLLQTFKNLHFSNKLDEVKDEINNNPELILTNPDIMNKFNKLDNEITEMYNLHSYKKYQNLAKLLLDVCISNKNNNLLFQSIFLFDDYYKEYYSKGESLIKNMEELKALAMFSMMV